MSENSIRQKVLFEAIHDEYHAHYFDQASMDFRNNFVYDPIFHGLDLNNKIVADLASGDGSNSMAVLKRFPKADVIGFDISRKACEDYRTLLNKPAYELDLTSGINPGIKVDVAMVFGGIHHCVADLQGTFKTISHLLKPGGLLLMYEPNKYCYLELARKLWYQYDRFFDAKTEAALNHDKILKSVSTNFSLMDCKYFGGPAYFLIYNSLILRIPLRIKKFIAPPLFFLERLYNLIPGKVFFPYYIARWHRNYV